MSQAAPATVEPQKKGFAAAAQAMAAGQNSKGFKSKPAAAAAAPAAPVAAEAAAADPTADDSTQVSGATPAASDAADDAVLQGTDAADDADQDSGLADDQQQDQNPGQLFTVKVNGETQQVPLDKLIHGFQDNASNTRKAQENASKAKELDTLKVETGNVRNQLSKELGVVRQVLATLLPTPDQMKQALAENRSADYLAMQKQWSEFKVIVDRTEGLGKEQSAQTEEQRKVNLSEEMKQLVEKQPAFSNPETQSEVANMLLDVGFPREDVARISDHRQLIIAWKALQFDKLTAQGHKAHQEVRKLPTMARPAARQNAQSSEKQLVSDGKKLLAQNGSVPDGMRGQFWGRHIK